MDGYLKTATLFVNTPHSNMNEFCDAPDRRRFRGRSGRRIVFSCTWKEKRKNDIEDASIAQGRIGRVGVVTIAASSCFFVSFCGSDTLETIFVFQPAITR